MNMNHLLRSVGLLSVLLLLAGCDQTSMNEYISSAPVITSFEPVSGNIGTDVVITGEHLDDVTSATVGGSAATIVEKVSNKRLTIRVAGEAKTGKIVLANAIGDGTSDQNFEVTYVAPDADQNTLPAEVEMGNNLLIGGERMNVISAVIFTAKGNSVGHEATIVTQSTDEIVVKVPYVEDDIATIAFSYYDGTKTTVTSPTKPLTVKRYQPVVSTTSFPVAEVGDIITLAGSYMNKVNKVFVSGVECTITSQTESQLQFLVPSSANFVDGNNKADLVISYFDNIEQKLLTDKFTVKVPFVYFWKDKKIWGQGRDVEEMTSFFSPETGMAYSNSMWRETVDPIAYKYMASTCSAKNVPAVTETEYNSVNPYFFFSGVSGGTLQINSPAGSNSQLKNYYYFNNSADEYRVTGANGSCYGAPVLTFVYLDPSVSSHKALIDQVASGSLEKIDEQTFPIDVAQKKIGNISIESVKQSVNNSVWAPGVFTVGIEKSANVDGYLLVLYYNYKGQNTANSAENIKRIGIIHIKHVDFRMWNNTKAPSSSSVTFDMYWMKHDYDYSKVN